MSSTDSYTWGAEAFSRGGPGERRSKSVSKPRSLLGARMAAVIIDGLVLLVPVFAIAWILSLLFPHHGFFFSKGAVATTGSATIGYTLGLPGLLVVAALSLSYFYLGESVRGKTVGKHAMRLHVRSASGGQAGINAISARTVLRLIDALPFFYLVGALVAILTGSRRRRIGDWIGGTVVEHEGEAAEASPHRVGWQVAIYPIGWLTAVLVAVFALGLGNAAGQQEAAIGLVHSYVAAREHGDASLACAMLTREQQRELVSLQSNDRANATASLCPAYVLRNDPSSHLLNPTLPEVASAPLASRYVSLGAVVVRSENPPMELIAVPEKGELKLDMRGVERLGFLRECTATGALNSSVCDCIFAWMRAQEAVPERGVDSTILRAIREDRLRCQSNAALPQ